MEISLLDIGVQHLLYSCSEEYNPILVFGFLCAVQQSVLALLLYLQNLAI